MYTLRSVALLTLLAPGLSACGGGDAKPTAPPPPAGTSPSPSAPTVDPRTEPYEVTVAHVLFAYKGAARSKAGRSKEQAYALAKSAIKDLKSGRPFEEVVALTDDVATDGRPNAGPDGPGAYRVTRGASMAKRFIEGAFATPLGQVADEPVETEFGYHVMKRLK